MKQKNGIEYPLLFYISNIALNPDLMHKYTLN